MEPSGTSIGNDRLEELLARGMPPEETYLAGTILVTRALTCHRPSVGVVFVVQQGRGEVLVEGHFLPCEPGQAYLCPPGVLFSLRPMGTWGLAWLATARQALPESTQTRIALGPVEDLEAVMAAIATREETTQDPLLAEAEENLATIALARLHAQLDGALGFTAMWIRVGEDLGYPWSLGEIASLAGLNPEQLRLECLARFGTSPMAQVTNLRMARGRALLAQGMPEGEVATAVGYAGVASFRAAMRRVDAPEPNP